MSKPKIEDVSARLEILATEAKDKFILARKGSEASLLNYKAVGEILLEAKELHRKGYLAWAKEHLDIGKQWCANLTFLAANWADYEQARTWVEDKGEVLGRKEFGVDGAVALTKKFQKSLGSTASTESEESGSPKRPSKVQRLEDEVADLKRQLEEVLAQNARLMEQLNAGPRSDLAPPLDSVANDQAEEVSHLWQDGVTPGEGTGAEPLLHEMAQSHEWVVDAFSNECVIERPVNWTTAEAA